MPAPSSRRLLAPAIALVIALLPLSAARAQTSQQLLQQLNAIVQQMPSASDPCPLFSQLQVVLTRFAQQDPDTYTAMRPLLDSMAQNPGCPTASAPARAQVSSPSASSQFRFVPAAPNPSPSTVRSTGNASPPTCVVPDVNGPCIPIQQYRQSQAAIAQAPVSIQPPTHQPTPWPSIVTFAGEAPPGTPDTHTCPAAGHLLTGHYASEDAWEGESIPCTPGRTIQIRWPEPTESSSPQPFIHRVNLLTSGDCVLQRGELTLSPGGEGQWQAWIHTNHTTNRDIWHLQFEAYDASGQPLFPIFLGDSPAMFGSPSPTIPWAVNFSFTPTLLTRVATVRITRNSC